MGEIPKEMETALAKQTRTEYIAMSDREFSARLAGMRKSIEAATKKENKWNAANPVRRQMQHDIIDGWITPDMDFEEAIQVRAIYEPMGIEKFTSRLTSLREIIKEKQQQALEDVADLIKDRLECPRPTHNARGEPEWSLHEAKELLAIDMDDDLHKKLTPEQLYWKRLQYRDFPLTTFRGHIYQEEHTRKWRFQWVDGKKHYPVVPNPCNEDDI